MILVHFIEKKNEDIANLVLCHNSVGKSSKITMSKQRLFFNSYTTNSSFNRDLQLNKFHAMSFHSSFTERSLWHNLLSILFLYRYAYCHCVHLCNWKKSLQGKYSWKYKKKKKINIKNEIKHFTEPQWASWHIKQFLIHVQWNLSKANPYRTAGLVWFRKKFDFYRFKLHWNWHEGTYKGN